MNSNNINLAPKAFNERRCSCGKSNSRRSSLEKCITTLARKFDLENETDGKMALCTCQTQMGHCDAKQSSQEKARYNIIVSSVVSSIRVYLRAKSRSNETDVHELTLQEKARLITDSGIQFKKLKEEIKNRKLTTNFAISQCIEEINNFELKSMQDTKTNIDHFCQKSIPNSKISKVA